MVPHSPLVLTALAVWAAVITVALSRGRGPERLTALIFIVAMALSFLGWGGDVNGRRYPTFVGDILISLVLVLVATRTRRKWATWAAPLQLLSTATFATKFVDPTIGGYSYLLIEQVLGFAVLGLLLWGILIEVPLIREDL